MQTAKNYVDNYLERDFEEEAAAGEIPEVPEGIEDAALRLASNLVWRMKKAQNDFIVTRDDGSTEFQSTRVFTKDIKDDLDLFPTPAKKPRFRRNRSLPEIARLEKE